MNLNPALFPPDERKILQYLDRFGALPQARAEREGWTIGGLPTEPLRNLIRLRIVAPRVLTSYPLRCSWELRHGANTPERAAARAKMQEEYGLREYVGSLSFVGRPTG